VQVAILCSVIAAGRVHLGATGTAAAILVSFLMALLGLRFAFMFLFLGACIYHHLFCLDAGVAHFVFALLVPTISLVFMVAWTDMNEVGLCKAMLPIHIWLAGLTFPATWIWFWTAGWINTSFNILYKDSFLLSVLHNQFGPTAIPFKILIPIQVATAVLVTFLAAGTCGALEQFDTNDAVFMGCALAIGNLVLFVIPYGIDKCHIIRQEKGEPPSEA